MAGVDVEGLDLPKVLDELDTRNIKARCALVQRLVNLSADSTEDDYVQGCLKTIFLTAYHWDEKSSQLAVENLIKAVAADASKPAFPQRFMARFNKHSKVFTDSKKSYAHGRELMKLVRGALVMLTAAGSEKVTAMGDMAVFIKNICLLLEKLLTHTRFHKNIRTLLLDQLFTAQPDVAAAFFEVVSKEPSKFFFATRLLVEYSHAATLPAEIATAWVTRKQAFLQWFSADVIGTRAELSAEELSSWGPFIRTITHEDMTETIVPATTRFLKRAPETSVPVVIALVGGARIDMSRYNDGFFTAALVELTGKEEARRDIAVELVRVLARTSSDPEVLEKMTKELGEKMGAQTQWEIRDTFMRALQASSEGKSAGIEALQKNAGLAIAALLPVLTKDPLNRVKITGVGVLAKWTLINGKCPPPVAEHILKVITGKYKADEQDLVVAYLQASLELLELKDFGVAIMGASKEISGLVKAAVATPATHRFSGLLAADLLVSASVKVGKSLGPVSSIVLDPFTTSKSFVTGTLLVRKSTDAEGEAHARFFETVMKNRLLKAGANVAPGLSAIIELALHPSNIVARSAVKAAVAAVTVDETLIEPFLAAFFDALHGPISAGLEASAHSYHTLLAALCSAIPASGDALALSLLIACDPRARLSNQKPAALWNNLCAKWKATGGTDVPARLTQDWACVEALVMSDAGLWSTETARREAASVAVVCAVQAHGSLLKELMPGVIGALKVVKTTEKEAAIYRTNDGVLCDWHREGEYQAKVVENKNVRRAKGGIYSAKDEEWERQLAEEMKAKGKGKVVKVDPVEVKKLAEEKAFRDRLKALVAKVATTSALLGLLATAAPNAMRDYALPAGVLDALYATMKSVAGHLALAAHTNLSSCLDRRLVPHKELVAAAVQRCVIDGDAALADSVTADTMRRALETCVGVVQRTPLDAGSLLFILPLIKMAITAKAKVNESEDGEEVGVDETRPTLEAAFELLCAHCGLGRVSTAGSGRGTGSARGRGRGRGGGDANVAAMLGARGRGGARGGRGGSVAVGVPAVSVAIPALVVDPNAARFPFEGMVSLLLFVLGGGGAADLQARAEQALLSLAPNLSAQESEAMLGSDGVFSASSTVRCAVLRAIGALELGVVSPPVELVSCVWLLGSDADESVKTLAVEVWTKLGAPLPADFATRFLELLTYPSANVRSSAGAALNRGCVEHPTATTATLESLVRVFRASKDKVVDFAGGFRQAEEVIDNSPARAACARAMADLSPSLGQTALLQLLLDFCLREGLADPAQHVWEAVLAAGQAVVEEHGAEHLDLMLSLFERNMRTLDNIALTPEEGDKVQEGLVVLLGAVAKHLDGEDPKVIAIIDRLVEALKTPSLSVQTSVAKCLPALMPLPVVGEHHVRLVKQCLTVLAEGDGYGQRKGAAFGLAAMVKGLKLSALKKHDILPILTTYIEDKDNAKARQGALFAYDRLFCELGSKFEPYVDHILPSLLASFSDPNPDVREAAAEASAQIMANLTGYGVQRALPRVLGALEEKGWKTKVESVTLLGSMAYCAPRQLSSCLPQIVPRLLEVMTDPNKKLQESTRSALSKIGSVIRNPEIRLLVPRLLKAISDPTANTEKALQSLMKTSFVHAVDPASLALIIPILRRGLRDRVSHVKKMAAQVVGSMCSLIADTNDLLPYASTLLKYLKMIIVDNIPEVRAVGARSLGALFKGLGEDNCGDLVTYLIALLDSDTTAVQRAGAAQALANIMKGLGPERTEELLPGISDKARTSQDANVREAYMGVYQYMPDTFGTEFAVYLEDVFPCVVAGLADDIGTVRDVALKSGQALVIKFARSETDMLLPALETGIRSGNWRIRLSSVQLLGSLLLRLSGASGALFVGDGLGDEDEDSHETGVVTLAQELLVEDLLGRDRRDEIFAMIYLMRSDVMSTVRQMSWRVWKGVVSNTPRMLGNVLNTLMDKVIADLASDNEEQQQAAGAALGDLVQKMGDAVLQKIVPILQQNLISGDAKTRQGVCQGLSEVMKSGKKSHVVLYLNDLVPAVRDALCDRDPEVRQAAGNAFQTLHRNIGQRAIDEIVPTLLARLSDSKDPVQKEKKEKPEGEEGDEGEDDESEAEESDDGQLVVEAMREVLGVCNQAALPYLIPELIKSPMSVFHARALASLSDSFGHSFHRYVATVTESLVQAISESQGLEKDKMREAASLAILCVTQDSVHTLIELLSNYIKVSTTERKTAAAQLMAAFCKGTECEYDSHVPAVLKSLLSLYAEEDVLLHTTAKDALNDVLETLDKEDLMDRVAFISDVIRKLTLPKGGGPAREFLPGLGQKGGLAPLLPVYQHALMHGAADIREHAASGLGQLITLTPTKSLSPYVIKITGPLIRIVGDRFPGEVKAAILKTLGLLIGKTGALLKAFLPQLQTTFLKALADPEAEVRNEGAAALAALMPHSRRVDPVVTELTTNIRSPPEGDDDVRESYAQAVVGIVGGKVTLTAPVVEGVVDACVEAFESEHDGVRRSCGEAVGVAGAKFYAVGDLDALVKRLSGGSDSWREREAQSVALTALYRCVAGPESFANAGTIWNEAAERARKLLVDDNAQVKARSAMLSATLLASPALPEIKGNAVATSLLQSLCDRAKDDGMAVRQSVMKELSALCQSHHARVLPQLAAVIKACMQCAADTNQVRMAAQDCLVHALQLEKGDVLLNQYVGSGVANGKAVAEYCRKHNLIVFKGL